VVPDRFTAERNALAKRLRSQGAKAEAERVRGLRKPTAAAWAVNQLSRRDPQGIGELIEAGRALRRLESELLEGRADAEALRAAAARERELAEGLVAEAQELLAERGGKVGGAVVDRVSETLRAAAMDPEVEADVRQGTLTREQRAASVGVLAPDAAAQRPRPSRAKRSRERTAEARRAERSAARRVERAESARERAAGRLERARETMRERERELEAAEDELTDAAAELERAKRAQ
jgi:hypothetical protein